MCGRFTITLDASVVQEELELGEMPKGWIPRYNVAPSQPIPVVTSETERKVEWMQWGLIPSWAKDPAIGQRLINARSETLAEKPSFRNAFKRRRCLILADGFYEWKRPGGKGSPAVPFYFMRKDRRAFAFAGLWEYWQSSLGDEMVTAAIITCPPNAVVQKVHKRMPVILEDQFMWAWLKQNEQNTLQSMLKPYSDDLIESYEVARDVNTPRNDRPELIMPVTGEDSALPPSLFS